MYSIVILVGVMTMMMSAPEGLTPWPMAMEGAVQEEDVPAKVKDK
jgi:hypothetical protein